MPAMFQYEFVRLGIAAGMITAIIAPVIGCFLVMRRYSFMADTISHVSLAGVAIGLLTGIHPVLSAAVTAIIVGIWVEKIRQRQESLPETTLAICLSGGLALAAVLLSLSRGINVSLHGILFGSIATITREDVSTIALLGIVVLCSIGLLYRWLTAIAFDEELALTSGVPVRFVNHSFILLTAMTVTVSMRIVGALLISALMIVPVAAAMRLVRSTRSTLLLAICLSCLSMVGGMFISYIADTSSGGTIVLVAIGCFVATDCLARILRR